MALRARVTNNTVPIFCAVDSLKYIRIAIMAFIFVYRLLSIDTRSKSRFWLHEFNDDFVQRHMPFEVRFILKQQAICCWCCFSGGFAHEIHKIRNNQFTLK